MKSLFCILVSLFVLPFAAGCALHRSEIPVASPLPASFSEPGADTSAPPVGKWWEQFNDPTLTVLIEEALADNLDVAQAYARLRQAEAVAATSGSARRPFASLGGQANRNSQPASTGNIITNTYRLSLSAGFEIDLWQKLKDETMAATLIASASREDIKTLYLTLTARVADLYYLAVEQRAELGLLDSLIASNVDTLTLVEARYNEGLAQPLDVYQARENLAAVRSRRPVSTAILAVTEHALAVLLGRYPEKDIAGDLATLPLPPAASPTGLPANLLQNRPDIRAAVLRVAARDKQLAAAIADRFPSFNLLADYGRSRTRLNAVVTGTFWDFIAQAALPVVDGGRRRAEVDRTRALLQEELARYQQVVLRAFQEVDDALAQNATSEERVQLLSNQLQNANNGARLALDNYLSGLQDYLPVLIAQRLQMELETQLLVAKRQLISDRISLIRALGDGWLEELIVLRVKQGT